jgi:hypothetical protein
MIKTMRAASIMGGPAAASIEEVLGIPEHRWEPHLESLA